MLSHESCWIARARRAMFLHALIALAASLLCSTAVAQLSFTPIAFENTQAYGSPNGPTDLFVADLNGDRKPDIVTTQSTSNAVTVFLNQGAGVFIDGGSAH